MGESDGAARASGDEPAPPFLLIINDDLAEQPAAPEPAKPPVRPMAPERPREPAGLMGMRLGEPVLPPVDETVEVEGFAEEPEEPVEVEGEDRALAPSALPQPEAISRGMILAPPETLSEDLEGAEGEERVKPPAAVDYFIRLRPTEDAFAGATFRERELIGIGRSPDQDVYVEHDLVAASHAEIMFREECFEVSPVAGNAVFVNDQPVNDTLIVCRGDLITLVGPGGPSFRVEMLKPDRPPGKPRSRLPWILRPFGFYAEPLAELLGLSPWVVVIGSVLVALPLVLGVALLMLLIWTEPNLLVD